MTLQEKLTERRRQQSIVSLRQKLTSVPGLGVEELDNNPELFPARELWRQFSSYEREPQYRIPDEDFADAGRSVLKLWLEFLGAPKVLHLSVGGYGDLPWLRTTLSDSLSLFELFNTVGDFIALDAKSNRVLGIMEGEHDKLIFMGPKLARNS